MPTGSDPPKSVLWRVSFAWADVAGFDAASFGFAHPSTSLKMSLDRRMIKALTLSEVEGRARRTPQNLRYRPSSCFKYAFS